MTATVREITLMALAEYYFLSASQLMRLPGMPRTRSNLHRVLRPMRQQKLLWMLNFPCRPDVGRFESLFCLTAKGRDALIEEQGVTSDIRFSSYEPKPFTRTYTHRKRIVDVHMALKAFADRHELREQRFIPDFLFSGVNKGRSSSRQQPLRSQARIDLPPGSHKDFVVPDLVFTFRHSETSRYGLFLAEICISDDLGHIINDNVFGHAALLEADVAWQAFNLPAPIPPRILMICENPSTMESTRQRIHSIRILEELHEFFLLSTCEKVMTDPSTAFVTPDGTPAQFIA